MMKPTAEQIAGFPELSGELFRNAGCDGAHRGISDFYDKTRKLLERALWYSVDFDTGWYSVKHESYSGRVRRTDNTVYCEAHATDDFDTEGVGCHVLKNGDIDLEFADEALKVVLAGLDTAADIAEQNRRDNAVFAGFAIGKTDDKGERVNWLYSYIAPIGDGCFMDEPPGDYYQSWGWEDCRGCDDDELPEDVKEVFETFVDNHLRGVWVGDRHDTCQGWRIDPWRDE